VGHAQRDDSAQEVRGGCERLEDLLHIAERTLGHAPPVRDYGLLESALTRPRATAFGEDAYPDIHHKAAALLHSPARNHALADGNKRLALAALLAFHGMNGLRVTPHQRRRLQPRHGHRGRPDQRRHADRLRTHTRHSGPLNTTPTPNTTARRADRRTPRPLCEEQRCAQRLGWWATPSGMKGVARRRPLPVDVLPVC
jgi:prophage maintenance system killer protein